MKYSYSQIRTFGKCQYKWHLNYKEGLIPPPSDVMSFGKFGHKMIENVLYGRDILHDIVVGEGEFDMTEMQELQDMIDDARTVVELFLETLPLSDWETVEVDGEPLIEKKLERASNIREELAKKVKRSDIKEVQDRKLNNEK